MYVHPRTTFDTASPCTRQSQRLKEGAANIPGEFLREGLTGVVTVKVRSSFPPSLARPPSLETHFLTSLRSPGCAS